MTKRVKLKNNRVAEIYDDGAIAFGEVMPEGTFHQSLLLTPDQAVTLIKEYTTAMSVKTTKDRDAFNRAFAAPAL